MKKTIARIALACGIYLGLLWGQFGILSILTESWMILGILLMCSARLMLWASPFALSKLVWLFGLIRPRAKIKTLIIANLVVLLLNALSFLFCYLLTGGWF